MNDLYDDLDDVASSLILSRSKEELDKLSKQVAALTTDNEELKQQVSMLLKDRNNLEENIQAIYNTALREIERKDKEIASLRSQVAIARAKK